MQLSQAGVHERVLATEFEYSVRMAGASRLAYPTMAGGGSDTCTIHYGRNDKRVGAAGGSRHTAPLQAGCVQLVGVIAGAYMRANRLWYNLLLQLAASCILGMSRHSKQGIWGACSPAVCLCDP